MTGLFSEVCRHLVARQCQWRNRAQIEAGPVAFSRDPWGRLHRPRAPHQSQRAGGLHLWAGRHSEQLTADHGGPRALGWHPAFPAPLPRGLAPSTRTSLSSVCAAQASHPQHSPRISILAFLCHHVNIFWNLPAPSGAWVELFVWLNCTFCPKIP